MHVFGAFRGTGDGRTGRCLITLRAGKGWGTGISSGTTISLIIAATALVGLAGTAAFLLARRRRPAPAARDDRLVQAVDEMRTRMDDLGRDLSEALERAERESKRNRFLSDLGSSIEFEELLERILDAALEVPGFDAAMVVLEEAGGTSAMATRGMTPEEAAHPPSSGAAGALPPGPITVSYRYGAADAADTQLIRGGLFVPLVSREGQSLGSLGLFWRRPGYEPSSQRVGAIEQIAATCIPAIENARRYREARQLAETDALTGFFNQRYFHETLRREALRAQRYDRQLALLIIDLDDFKAVNDRIGHLAGDAVLAQVAEQLRNEIRSVDIGCRVGGDEFGVIMPESTSEDASQLFQRMHDARLHDVRAGRGPCPDLRRDRGAAPRGDGGGPLRAGGLGALPREGPRQGPREHRHRLSEPQSRTATRRSARDGRSAPPACSSVTPTRAPRGTAAESGTTRSEASKVAGGERVRRARPDDPGLVRHPVGGCPEAGEHEDGLVRVVHDERDPPHRPAERIPLCGRVGEDREGRRRESAPVQPRNECRGDERPRAERDRGHAAAHRERGERRPARSTRAREVERRKRDGRRGRRLAGRRPAPPGRRCGRASRGRG